MVTESFGVLSKVNKLGLDVLLEVQLQLCTNSLEFTLHLIPVLLQLLLSNLVAQVDGELRFLGCLFFFFFFHRRRR